MDATSNSATFRKGVRHMMSRVRRSMADKDQGFTLIELLVVIMIIGTLAAIAIPNYLNQRKKAVDSTMKSDLTRAAITVESWVNDNPTLAVPLGDDFTSTNLGTGALLGVKVSPGNTISIKPSGTLGSYCLGIYNASGSLATATGTRMQYRSTDAGLLATAPAAFTCP